METVCKKNQCCGCHACADICPVSAIQIIDSLEFFNAVIDPVKCIHCHRCEKICQCNHSIKLQKPILWKQGWAEEETRKKSSSGGFATAIMNSFAESGGYVTSCAFSKGQFIFDIVNDRDGITKFTGSKYVKSNPAGIYNKIRERLKQGNKVLFIGLPCQVAAVYKYINDDLQEGLYTIDLICHGTPSPKVLQQALAEYNGNYEKADAISFRDKTKFAIRLDEKNLAKNGTADRYTTAFLSGISYTENCYHCMYATVRRVGDITLGDSWGTDLNSEIRKGVSLALCQTKKGLDLLENSGLYLFDVDLTNAINNNAQLRMAAVMPRQRKHFFNMIINEKGFKKAVRATCVKACLRQDIKRFLLTVGLIHR